MDKMKEVIKILSNPSLNDFGKGQKVVEIVRRMEQELTHRQKRIDELHQNLKSSSDHIKRLERLIDLAVPNTKDIEKLLKNE